MNQHEVIAKVADLVERDEFGVCADKAPRKAFALMIRRASSLIGEEDGAKLLAPIIQASSAHSPEFSDNGTVVLSDLEYDALPEKAKVRVSGLPHVVKDGCAYRASIYPDGRAQSLARQFCAEERSIVSALQRQHLLPCPIDDLYVAAPEDDINCPVCGSSNVTPFYSEIDTTEFHCNECDIDFEVDGLELPSLEDRSFEDIELIPEEGIHATYSTDGLHHYVGIFDKANESLCADSFNSQDDADAFMAGFVAAFDSIKPGVTVANINSGDKLEVSSVQGDTVQINGMNASRGHLAARVACDGTMTLLSTPIFSNDVLAGDRWRSDERVAKVESVEDDTVYYRDIEITGSRGQLLVDDVQGFLGKMDEGGYVQEL